MATPLKLPAGFLSASGSQIVDQYGNPVRIASIGWKGGDGTTNGPEGLDQAGLQTMMNNIASLGFNCVRLPWNDAGYFGNGASTYLARNGSNGNNTSLETLSPLLLMDAVISAAKAAGLKVILDHHTNEGGASGWGGQQSNGLWYDLGGASNNTDGNGNAGTVSQSAFQSNWVAFANRYKGNDTVIGFDLHNEPLAYSGMCTWGDGGTNDIKAMFQTVGNAILAANPDVLIICEGPQNYNGNFAGTGSAPEGDLSLVGSKPVSLSNQAKLVYSVHEYPTEVAGSGSAPDTGSSYWAKMNKAWGYIVTQGIAPVWIGEMGSSMQSTDGTNWSNSLVPYLNGTSGASGAPTFSGSQQGVSTSWWVFGYLPGQTPNGILQNGWGDPTPIAAQTAVTNQLQFVAKAASAPTAPTLTLGTATSTAVPLSWTVPSGTTPITYQVQFKQHSTTAWSSFGGSTSSTSTTVTGLQSATSYDFQVIASNSAGSATSATKNTLTTSPSATVPSAPTNLAANSITQTSMVIAWNASSSGSTPITYKLQYRLHSTASTPASPPASSAYAKTPAGMLSYFSSISGSHTISGQFIETGGLDAINTIQANTGKYLGLIGGDYWHYGGTGSAITSFNADAITWWNNKGLVTLICSIPNPTTGGASYDLNSLDAANMLTTGSATNNALKASLDSIATGLQELKNNGVVVLFRPFHELNGNWFWWGTKLMSNSQFISLWQYVYNYLTTTKGLNNLVWIWSVNSGFSSFPATPRYPGDNYVDMTGQDFYSSSPSSASTDYGTLVNLGKPVCLAEFGSGGPSAGDTSFDETVLISSFKSYMPKTLFWQQWWDGNGGNTGWGMAEVQNVKAALTDPWVLNRGDLAFFNAGSSSTESADKTVVTNQYSTITDSYGNSWGLSSGGQVVVNSAVDGTTSNVVELAYVTHRVYQKNNAGLWWSKSQPSDQWSPPNGTTTAPL